MRNQIRKVQVICGAIVVVVAVSGCNFSSRLTLANRTFTTLTPYPVNLDLEPPRREADPAHNIESGGALAIEPHGLNPVFYATGINDETLANGVYIGLNLIEADPMQIQYKLFHYRVPPGEAGKDPDLQPMLIETEIVEVDDVDTVIGVLGRDVGEQWHVRILPE